MRKYRRDIFCRHYGPNMKGSLHSGSTFLVPPIYTKSLIRYLLGVEYMTVATSVEKTTVGEGLPHSLVTICNLTHWFSSFWTSTRDI